jgi:hypothetical protein
MEALEAVAERPGGDGESDLCQLACDMYGRLDDVSPGGAQRLSLWWGRRCGGRWSRGARRSGTTLLTAAVRPAVRERAQNIGVVVHELDIIAHR